MKDTRFFFPVIWAGGGEWFSLKMLLYFC